MSSFWPSGSNKCFLDKCFFSSLLKKHSAYPLVCSDISQDDEKWTCVMISGTSQLNAYLRVPQHLEEADSRIIVRVYDMIKAKIAVLKNENDVFVALFVPYAILPNDWTGELWIRAGT